MNVVLVRKLLRDARTGLLVVCLLLGAFEFLWGKATEQAIFVVRAVEPQMPIRLFEKAVYNEESGKFVQKMIGEKLSLSRGFDHLTIGYIHPLVLVILCFWAIGRASGSVAGELDRGTLELLLAQPIPRWRLIVSHGVVDVLTIPVLCLCMWAGTWLGVQAFDLVNLTAREEQTIDAWRFVYGLPNVAALLFAVSGYTMLLSAAGRWRPGVLGLAVVLTLIQFVVNLLGQIWKNIEGLRPFTVFYYYQPQTVILGEAGADRQLVVDCATLLAVGLAGYVLALVVFCRRDLPAPL
jgi:ABC-2 type transport system permease protein